MFTRVSSRPTIALALLLAMAVTGCKKKEVTIPQTALPIGKTYASPVTKMITNKVNLVKRVVADTLLQLAPGLKQTTINYVDYSDQPMRLFVLEVAMADPRIRLKAGTPNNATAYGKQTVADIARLQDAPGNRVVAAINGDYYNVVTGEPQSVLYKGGAAVKPVSALCALCTFLYIDETNTPTIVDKSRTVDATKIKEAIGGYHWLVKDGARVTQGDPSIEPRTALGVTADKVVYLVVVDGRQPAYSNGMSFRQLSEVFAALGVKDAINLDGGGSSTMVLKQGSQWVVKNQPSDGASRAVANAWTIVDTHLP